MNAESLSAVAGILLSLTFSYIPGLSHWFDELEPIRKRLIMGILIVLVGVVAFGLGCASVIGGITCDQPGAMGLINAVIAALVANQAAYLISPRRVQ